MPTTTHPDAIQPCPAGSLLRRAALHCLMGVPHDRGATDESVSRLIEQAPEGIEPVWALCGPGGEVRFAAAAVPSPGATALILLSRPPSASGSQGGARAPAVLQAAGEVVAAVRAGALERGATLVQALLLPGDEASERILTLGGLRRLTRLVYLRARADRVRRPRGESPPGLEWHSYDDRTHGLFGRAIAATYEGSEDCPELSNLRSIDDVIAGHRAVGRFDPSLWSAATIDGTPAAALLLNPLDSVSAAEVVYIGVAQPYRGRGLASAALARAFDLARSKSVTTVALAVDERNATARKVYERWGFVETGVRDAWIASASRE